MGQRNLISLQHRPPFLWRHAERAMLTLSVDFQDQEIGKAQSQLGRFPRPALFQTAQITTHRTTNFPRPGQLQDALCSGKFESRLTPTFHGNVLASQCI
jgi:hypothetical protein